MSKHTPAPWTQHEIMRDCVTFEGAHGIENLFLCNVEGYYACQNEHDAALISAAPELLEALKNLVNNLCESDEEGLIGHSNLIDDARTAIAKAEANP